MKTMLLCLGLVFASSSVFAAGPTPFIRLKDGVSRYVEYLPAKPGRPTVVMVNGLVYATERWNPFRSELARRGYGLLNYDFRGQRFTLRREIEEKGTPEFFRKGLNSEVMADELAQTLDALNLRRPVVVVGLSYGAHIAAEFAKRNPARTQALVFLAPLVIPLDRYNPQGQWVFFNLELLKLTWGPVLGPVFYEAAYAQIYRSYYRQRIVPERVPPELRDHTVEYRESVFHLTRAVRDFDLRTYDFAALRTPKVHFITAGEEDANALRDQLQAFDRIHPTARGVLVHLAEASHAIPDTHGAIAADLFDRILTRDARLQPGRKYVMTSKGIELWNGAHAIQTTTTREYSSSRTGTP